MATEATHRSGVIAIIVAVAALSFGDAMIKRFSVELPLWQLFILRSMVAIPLLGGAIVGTERRLSVGSPSVVVVRCALLVTMWIAYYAALSMMPLALASGAYYSSPLLIVGLVAVLDRRRPSRSVLAALIGGMTGVLLVLRPDPSDLDAAALLPLAAAPCYAGAMVLTSRRCRDDDPLALAFWLNVAFVPAGIVIGLLRTGDTDSFVRGPWTPIDADLGLVAAVLGVCIVVGSVGAAIAYQRAPAVVVAGLDYSYLAFALVWGVVVFADWPSPLTLLGLAAITACGLLVVRTPTDSASRE